MKKRSNEKSSREAPWMPEKDFKELEHEIVNEVESKNALCTRETYFCSNCGRCRDNRREY